MSAPVLYTRSSAANRARVLAVIVAAGAAGISSGDVAAAAGLQYQNTYKTLARLREAGCVRSEGKTRTSRWFAVEGARAPAPPGLPGNGWRGPRRWAPAGPPAVPVRLVVMPIAQLEHDGQHFACEVLGARLSAGACVKRQAEAKAAAGYHDCDGCEDAPEIRRRVGRAN